MRVNRTGLTLLLIGSTMVLSSLVLTELWYIWRWRYYFDLGELLFRFLIPLAASVITLMGFAIFRSEYKTTLDTVARVPAKICTNCDAKITVPDASFCPSCGKKLKSST